MRKNTLHFRELGRKVIFLSGSREQVGGGGGGSSVYYVSHLQQDLFVWNFVLSLDWFSS